MFNVEPSYTVIPIIVESHEVFWNMTSHLGCAVSTWASYAEFTITAENLETALSYYEKKDLAWLEELRTVFFNTDADRYQFLHYEEASDDHVGEIVF